MSLPGGHPGFRVVHVPECYGEGGCIMLSRPLLSRQGQEETRRYMASREPWRSDPAWWAHDAICLCEPCSQAPGGRP